MLEHAVAAHLDFSLPPPCFLVLTPGFWLLLSARIHCGPSAMPRGREFRAG